MTMGLFWNLAAVLFVLAVLPIELLSPCRAFFVMAMSASVAAAILAEGRRLVRPD
jgi:hypothetical protein